MTGKTNQELHTAVREALREIPSIYQSIGKIQVRMSHCRYGSARYLELERSEMGLSRRASELKDRVLLLLFIESENMALNERNPDVKPDWRVVEEDDFKVFALMCARNQELIAEFDRLCGTGLACTSGLALAIDNATGKRPHDVCLFMSFVTDMWERLPRPKDTGDGTDANANKARNPAG